mgnify:CR=1 FL=1
MQFIGFFELHRRIAIWGTEVALGDYWMYLYGGMKEYIPTTGNPFQFPTMWIAVFLFSSFAVLNYPMKDLQKHGNTDFGTCSRTNKMVDIKMFVECFIYRFVSWNYFIGISDSMYFVFKNHSRLKHMQTVLQRCLACGYQSFEGVE